ncbi:MAG: hypothetical protein AAF939_10740 [Planctomycetota bacterium]
MLYSTIFIDHEETWPEIVARYVPMSSLSQDEVYNSLPQLTSENVVDFTGNQEDLTQLLAAVKAGRYPVEDWRVLREMPIKVPLNISAARTHGVDSEGYERALFADENQKTIQEIIDCYVSKAEDASPRRSRVMSSRGAKIDVFRLAELVAQSEGQSRLAC